MITDKIKQQVKQDSYLTGDSKAFFDQHADAIGKKEFSDIVDGDGNQYVNFVQQGGGVWGIALVGYLYALELFGIRFLRLAGTSAGAINTILIAAVNEKKDAKSGAIKTLLESREWNFINFVDGRRIVRWLLRTFVYTSTWIKVVGILLIAAIIILLATPIVTAYTQINVAGYVAVLSITIIVVGSIAFYYINRFNKHHYGANPGKTFLEALKTALVENKAGTIGALNNKYNEDDTTLKNKVNHRENSNYFSIVQRQLGIAHEENIKNIDEAKYKRFVDNVNPAYASNPLLQLKSDYTIVTTDINNKIKAELPRMANLYWDGADCNTKSAAEFVRASMSIPLFYEPFIKPINRTDKAVAESWKQFANIEPDAIPAQAVFIDGGSISNFPIDIFHDKDIVWPRLPVFGVRLTDVKPRTADEINAAPGGIPYFKNFPLFGGQIIDTIRSFNDNSFLMKYSFYNKFCIAEVNCYPSNWLNFDMSDQEKKELYNKGFCSAIAFLNRFEWADYKKERMIVAFKEAGVIT